MNLCCGNENKVLMPEIESRFGNAGLSFESQRYEYLSVLLVDKKRGVGSGPAKNLCSLMVVHMNVVDREFK